MNLSQLKQWLQNNLWWGENGRRDKQTIIASLLTPDTSRIWGVDVSHYNRPPVNFQRMKDVYGMSFAIMKGCDGSINTSYYPEHKAGIKAAGLPWGMYAWLYPSNKVNIDAQVNAWFARYNEDVPPLGLFIDAEWTYYAGQPANPTAADLRAACDKWYAKTGKRATIYTAKGYADQYLIGFDWSKEELWVAHYGVNTPSLPSGATKYTFWQFTSTLDGAALDPNGNKELDGNYFNGTAEQFAAKYGAATPPTGETTMAGYTFKSNIATETRSIRNGNGVTFAKVGDLAVGATAEGDFIFPYKAAYTANLAYAGDQWLHITKPIEGWLAIIHQGKTYGVLTPIPEPPAVDLSNVRVGVTLAPSVTFLDADGKPIATKTGTFTGELT